MWPIPGADKTQEGPMLATWTQLSGLFFIVMLVSEAQNCFEFIQQVRNKTQPY